MLILKKIGLVLVFLAILLVGIGFLLPRNVHVERSTTIDAPRATVFAQLHGFRTFNKWSPWAAMDPQAKYSYEGPDFGVGAKMSWTGNPKTVGTGSQEVIEVLPMEVVKTKLDFGDQGIATSRFTLTPEEGRTRVTWSFDTDLGMNPVSRYFGLLFDGMLGPDYEKGLAGLKARAEGLPKADFADLKVEKVDVEPVTVAYLSSACGTEEKAIAQAIGGAYAEVGRFMSGRGLKQAGPPVTINTKWEESGYEFDAAIPVDRLPENEVPAASAVKMKQTYAGKALKVVHKGAYREMPATYDKLLAFVAANGYEAAGAPWDEYVTDPGSTPEPELVTNVYVPVKD